MTQSNRLLFFGNEQIASGFKPQDSPTLQKLIDNKYNVVGVILQSKPSRSRKKHQFSTKEIAEANNIPVFTPFDKTDLFDIVKKLEPDIGVLISYGKIIPESVISLFKFGIINIHPSLLPYYRGSTPIEQAILDGNEYTGISIMKLVKKMDAGPILAQKKVLISNYDDKISLSAKLLETGGDMLIETLPKIINKSIVEISQDESKATFTPQIDKSDGLLDTSLSSVTLIRKIKAYKVWPGTKIKINLQNYKSSTLTIEDARETDFEIPIGEIGFNNNRLVLGTGTKAIELLKVTVPGKRPITGKEFARGYIKS